MRSTTIGVREAASLDTHIKDEGCLATWWAPIHHEGYAIAVRDAGEGGVRLNIVSLLAPNGDRFFDRLARYLARATGCVARAAQFPSWSERARLIELADADLSAMCGALFARRAEWIEEPPIA